jgi:hypothetical protein
MCCVGFEPDIPAFERYKTAQASHSIKHSRFIRVLVTLWDEKEGGAVESAVVMFDFRARHQMLQRYECATVT